MGLFYLVNPRVTISDFLLEDDKKDHSGCTLIASSQKVFDGMSTLI